MCLLQVCLNAVPMEEHQASTEQAPSLRVLPGFPVVLECNALVLQSNESPTSINRHVPKLPAHSPFAKKLSRAAVPSIPFWLLRH